MDSQPSSLPADEIVPTELERIAARHYMKYGSEQGAIQFAIKIDQIYPQVSGLYPSREVCASFMLKLLTQTPKAIISAQNLRTFAGANPSFSASLRAKL